MEKDKTVLKKNYRLKKISINIHLKKCKTLQLINSQLKKEAQLIAPLSYLYYSF
jgi:hypothetical protein